MLGNHDLKKIKKVIEGVLDGKTIQKYNMHTRIYEDVFTHNIDWDDAIRATGMYRVKPNPKYEPFSNKDECIEECKKHTPFGYVQNNIGNILSISAFYKDTVSICNSKVSYKDTLSYKFLDGTSFGKLIEDEE